MRVERWSHSLSTATAASHNSNTQVRLHTQTISFTATHMTDWVPARQSRFTAARANDRLHSDLPSILVFTGYFLAAQLTHISISQFLFRECFFSAFSVKFWHNYIKSLCERETEQTTKVREREREHVLLEHQLYYTWTAFLFSLPAFIRKWHSDSFIWQGRNSKTIYRQALIWITVFFLPMAITRWAECQSLAQGQCTSWQLPQRCTNVAPDLIRLGLGWGVQQIGFKLATNYSKRAVTFK